MNHHRLPGYLLSFVVFSLIPAPAWACSCAPFSLGFCQALPAAADVSRVVFVGKVTEFYPKSAEQMTPRMEEFGRTHRDLQDSLLAQSRNTGGRRVAGADDSPDLIWRKAMIEYVWGDTLTPAELQQLRAALDLRQLDRLGFDQRRRVRLEVLENFTRAEEPQFTLYTALWGPSCGFDFVEGETYRVDAYKNSETGTWQVTTCSRTRPIGQATEDLDVLRAWKSGHRLPGYIAGLIIDRPVQANGDRFQLQLRGANEVRETTSDSRGQFRFENLDPGAYEIEIGQPPVVSRPADLTHNGCAFVVMRP